MNVNDVSNIIELDDTFHILKMTEFNEAEVMPLEEMRDEIVNDLINSESIALMNDDYDLIDQMIFSNESIDSVSQSISKTLGEASPKVFDIDWLTESIDSFEKII